MRCLISKASPMSRPSPQVRLDLPSPRARGEAVRHALSDMLARGEIPDPVLDKQVVTVAGVRMSPDLKLATVSVMPLGGKDVEKTIAALAQHKKELRTRSPIASISNTRPTCASCWTKVSTRSARIDALLRSPEVARDLDTETFRGLILNALNSDARPDASAAEARPPRAPRGQRGEPRRSHAHRGQRLDQSRQAGRRHLDAGGRRAEVPVQRQEGGTRRHARPARLRRAADRVRRGDEDRAVRAGRRRSPIASRSNGAPRRTPTTPRAASSPPARTARRLPRSPPCCRASSA